LEKKLIDFEHQIEELRQKEEEKLRQSVLNLYESSNESFHSAKIHLEDHEEDHGGKDVEGYEETSDREDAYQKMKTVLDSTEP
jgi:hypothetical protein